MTFDRRQFVSGMAAMPFAMQLPRFVPPAGDRALIMLWLDGGMSHIDTFDGKPEASPDIRGDLKSRRCKMEGAFLSEHLPKLADRMHRTVLLRSVTHGEGNHDRGSAYLLTGHRPSPVLRHPSFGSVLASDTKSVLPAYVAIPDAPTHGHQGYLPIETGPFEVLGQPGRPEFAVRNLKSRPGSKRAIDLLAQVDALDGAPRSRGEDARDGFLAKAKAMSLDPSVRQVFDLGRESAQVRGRFGRHQMGQSLLLARRLVTAGTRAVLVRDRGWDHHRNIRRAMTYGFPPKLKAMDDSLSALIDDLHRNDLWDKVLVVVASEFGRTPRLNPSGGRDHWPRAQSVLMFGAGLKAGTLVGTTDRKGEEPSADPISPADVHATIVSALGGDVTRVLRSENGRPVRQVEVGGEPVREALAK